MAVDVQIVYPQESVKLTNIRFTEMGEKPALRVLGEDFTAVHSVLINDAESEDVLVVSSTELIATIPDNVVTLIDDSGAVSSVTVLSNRFTFTERSLLRLQLGAPTGRVKGIMRVVQSFLKLLLQRPGSDLHNPGLGGGLLVILGENVTGDGADVTGDAAVAVSTTERQMVAVQARDQRIPRSERLLSAALQSVQFDPKLQALYLGVLIKTQDGKAAAATLETT